MVKPTKEKQGINDLPKDLPKDTPKEDKTTITDIPPESIDTPSAEPTERKLNRSGGGNAPKGAEMMVQFLDPPPATTTSNTNASHIPQPPPLMEPKKRGRPAKTPTGPNMPDPFTLMTPKQQETTLAQLNKTLLGREPPASTSSPVSHSNKDTDYLFEQARLISRIERYQSLDIGAWLKDKDGNTRVFKIGKENNNELIGIVAKLQQELEFKDVPELMMLGLETIFTAASLASEFLPILQLNGAEDAIKEDPRYKGTNPFREEFKKLCTEIALEKNWQLSAEKRLALRVIEVLFFVRSMNAKAYAEKQKGPIPPPTESFEDL